MHCSRVSCVQGCVEPQYWAGLCVFHWRREYPQQESCYIFTIAKISGFTRILELAKNLNFRAFQAKIVFSKLDFQIFEHLPYMGCWHAQCQVHNPPSYTLNPVWCDVCHLMMHRGVIMWWHNAHHYIMSPLCTILWHASHHVTLCTILWHASHNVTPMHHLVTHITSCHPHAPSCDTRRHVTPMQMLCMYPILSLTVEC